MSEAPPDLAAAVAEAARLLRGAARAELFRRPRDGKAGAAEKEAAAAALERAADPAAVLQAEAVRLAREGRDDAALALGWAAQVLLDERDQVTEG